jgi:hypothetical protein
VINSTPAGVELATPNKYNDGNWYHAVAVYNGSKMMIYVNGQLVASASHSGPLQNTAHTVKIGRSDGGWPFNGTIDEVRVYNRSLTEEEIKMLYLLRPDMNNLKFVHPTFLSCRKDDVTPEFFLNFDNLAKGNKTLLLYFYNYSKNISDCNVNEIRISDVDVVLNPKKFVFGNFTSFLFYPLDFENNKEFENASFSLKINNTAVADLTKQNAFITNVTGNSSASVRFSLGSEDVFRNFYFNTSKNTEYLIKAYLESGLYTTFKTINVLGAPIPNATISIYRLVNNSYVLYDMKKTTTTGLASFLLPANTELLVKVERDGYQPAEDFYVITTSTSQPIEIILQVFMNATVTEYPNTNLRIVISPDSNLINATLNNIVFNVSINSSNYNLSGVNLTIYNTTFNSSSIVYSQYCTNLTKCYFSYTPTAAGTRYDCVLFTNVSNSTDTITYTTRTFFVTRSGNYLADERNFDKSLSGLWILIWFLLSAGITAISFRFLGIGSLFVFGFMLIFGQFLGFFDIFSYPASILIFVFIVIALLHGG